MGWGRSNDNFKIMPLLLQVLETSLYMHTIFSTPSWFLEFFYSKGLVFNPPSDIHLYNHTVVVVDPVINTSCPFPDLKFMPSTLTTAPCLPSMFHLMSHIHQFFSPKWSLHLKTMGTKEKQSRKMEGSWHIAQALDMTPLNSFLPLEKNSHL